MRVLRFGRADRRHLQRSVLNFGRSAILSGSRWIGYEVKRVAFAEGLRDEGIVSLPTLAPLVRIAFQLLVERGGEFIQVGANNAQTNDHLSKHYLGTTLAGALVEPQPSLFRSLQRKMAGFPSIQVVQAAVSQRAGVMPFYAIRSGLGGPEADAILSGLASLDYEHVVKHYEKYAPRFNIPLTARDAIDTVDVEVITFETLVGRTGLNNVQFVGIDTEGHDFHIIESMDLRLFRPAFILYEHLHMSMPQREKIWRKLAAAEYSCFAEWTDTFAIKNSG